MNYIISYPPNTKEVKATKHNFTVTVKCPHCGKTHHHNKISLYKAYEKATCGLGYYVLRST